MTTRPKLDRDGWPLEMPEPKPEQFAKGSLSGAPGRWDHRCCPDRPPVYCGGGGYCRRITSKTMTWQLFVETIAASLGIFLVAFGIFMGLAKLALRQFDPPECVEWIRSFRAKCFLEHPKHPERCEADVPKQRSHCEAKMAGRY